MKIINWVIVDLVYFELDFTVLLFSLVTRKFVQVTKNVVRVYVG